MNILRMEFAPEIIPQNVPQRDRYANGIIYDKNASKSNGFISILHHLNVKYYHRPIN